MDQPWVWSSSYFIYDHDTNIRNVVILHSLALSIHRRERISCRKRLDDSKDRYNRSGMRSSILKIMKLVTYPQMKIMLLETNNKNQETVRKVWARRGLLVIRQLQHNWEQPVKYLSKKVRVFLEIHQEVYFRWTEEDWVIMKANDEAPPLALI